MGSESGAEVVGAGRAPFPASYTTTLALQ